MLWLAAFILSSALVPWTVVMSSADQVKPTPIADLKGATAVARRALDGDRSGHTWVIIESKTIERPFGWVFFYTTERYRDTGDPKFLVPGNGPLVVERTQGSVHFLPTALPASKAIEQFEEVWRKSQKTNE